MCGFSLFVSSLYGCTYLTSHTILFTVFAYRSLGGDARERIQFWKCKTKQGIYGEFKIEETEVCGIVEQGIRGNVSPEHEYIESVVCGIAEYRILEQRFHTLQYVLGSGTCIGSRSDSHVLRGS